MAAFAGNSCDHGMELAHPARSSSPVAPYGYGPHHTSISCNTLEQPQVWPGSLAHHIQKGKICKVIGTHFPAPFSHPFTSPFSCVPSCKLSPFHAEQYCWRLYIIHTYRRNNMVKTGIPFMLHDSTGSLLESNFVELYDRMNLRVSCLSRAPNGAALYEVYNMLSRYFNIPVAVFEYGPAGALGDISFAGPGGSLQTQTMAAFLVEVGGYANTTSPLPPHPLHSFCVQALMPCFCKA